MLFGFDVLLERTMGSEEGATRSAQAASTVDKVDDTNVNLLQFLAKPVSDGNSRPIQSIHALPSCT